MFSEWGGRAVEVSLILDPLHSGSLLRGLSYKPHPKARRTVSKTVFSENTTPKKPKRH